MSLVLTALFLSRPFRFVISWAAIWGAVFGLWVIGPAALDTHHLLPPDLRTWAVLALVFAGAGGVFGAILTGIVTAPLLVALSQRWSPASPRLAAALWSMVMVPFTYFAVSVAIETSRYGRLVSGDPRRWQVQVAIASTAAAALGLIWIYRRLSRSDGRISMRRLRTLAVAAVVIGLVTMPFRISATEPMLDSGAPPLTRKPGGARRAPVVVVGFDGANWQTLRPLIDENRTPTLAALFKSGQHGNVEALWPPYWSGPAWAAIATGQPTELTGVVGDLVGEAPGLPAFEIPLELDIRLNPFYAVELGLILQRVIHALPMPRSQLKYPPVWERVEDAGGRATVIRFPFTYPARDPSRQVVTNIISTDLWGDLVGRWNVEPEWLLSPPSRADEVFARFREAADPDAPALVEIFPRRSWPKPADTPEDPVLVLQRIFDVSEKTLDAAEIMLEHDSRADLLMLHVSSFDSICHAFWKFRFPEEFPGRVSPADVEALGGVIDRYLVYLDRRIGRILAKLPAQANTIVVADHGHEGIASHVMWNGWHGRYGVFLAAGPDIAHRAEPLAVSYFDIVPLILDLMGYERPADLRQRGPAITSK